MATSTPYDIITARAGAIADQYVAKIQNDAEQKARAEHPLNAKANAAETASERAELHYQIDADAMWIASTSVPVGAWDVAFAEARDTLSKQWAEAEGSAPRAAVKPGETVYGNGQELVPNSEARHW